MNTPVALVTAALAAAILLATSLLIATGTRGDGALLRADTAARPAPTLPASK